MVGGGEGAFIGGVHRIALRLDGHYELVAGCFSSDLITQKKLEENLDCQKNVSMKLIRKWQKKSLIVQME